MRIITVSLAALIFIAMASFTPKVGTLTVTSATVQNNGNIPVKYTCLGQGINPPLSITDIPPDAKSLAIIVCDPDAPTKITTPVNTTKVTHKKGSKKKTVTTVKNMQTMEACTINGYTNWLMWNIDISGNIPEGFRTEMTGKNTNGTFGYQGMCPQSGAHHYHFMVYALDTKLNIDRNTDKAGLEKVMAGHILAKGELIGVYDKQYR
jgi:Raf kinase inhibitor-like YbhB/YbcL family protein